MALYLASKEYVEQLNGCHKTEKKFGKRGYVWGSRVLSLANEYKCKTALDFGCGNASFSKSVKGVLDVTNFDLGIPEYSEIPMRDFVWFVKKGLKDG